MTNDQSGIRLVIRRDEYGLYVVRGSVNTSSGLQNLGQAALQVTRGTPGVYAFSATTTLHGFYPTMRLKLMPAGASTDHMTAHVEVESVHNGAVEHDIWSNPLFLMSFQRCCGGPVPSFGQVFDQGWQSKGAIKCELQHLDLLRCAHE
jgi:hypothetical protein